jgi:cytochrome c1
MKKLIVLLFICAAVAVACGKKIMPESDAKNQSGPVNEKTEKTSGQSGNTNTSPSFNDMKGTQPVIPDGTKPLNLDAGKTVYVTKCTGCHTAKNPGDYTVDQTYSFLKVEIPKAKLSKNEAEDVTAYMIANAKR